MRDDFLRAFDANAMLYVARGNEGNVSSYVIGRLPCRRGCPCNHFAEAGDGRAAALVRKWVPRGFNLALLLGAADVV